MLTPKNPLLEKVYNTISETDNDDENAVRLEKAMNYYCGMWDMCEGFKHALICTLDDQYENHPEDQEDKDLQKLLDILTK